MKVPTYRSTLSSGFILVVLVSLYGCGGEASSGGPAPEPTVEHSQGWAHYQNPAEGFGLKTPDSWVFIKPTAADLNGAINAVKQASPSLASVLDSGPLRDQLNDMAANGVKMIAYDTSADGVSSGFATNLNMVHIKVPASVTDPTLDNIAALNVQELQKAFASMLVTKIENKHVYLGKLQGARLSYGYRINLASGPVFAEAVQYLALKGRDEYVLTFTTTSDELDQRQLTFQKISSSLELY